MPTQKPTLAFLKTSLGVAVLICFTLAPAWLVLRPVAEDGVAVIFPPGTGEPQQMAALMQGGARLIRIEPGRVYIVKTDWPDGFVKRLYHAGAMLVISPLVFGGCET